MFEFNRGDTFAFKTQLILQNREPVKESDIDTLLVTCKTGEGDYAEKIFQKTKADVIIDKDGYVHIEFKPEDTENLTAGKYFFDIEVTLFSGYRKSKLGTFILNYDVTDHKGE